MSGDRAIIQAESAAKAADTTASWRIRVRDATRFAPRIGFLLVAIALAAAIVRFQFMDLQLRPLRIAALGAGLLLGAWRVRYGIVALLFAAPLLGIIPRSLGFPDPSLAEHVVIPLLLVGALRCMWSNAPRPPTAIDKPLAVYMAMIAISAVHGLWEYCELGNSLWQVVEPQLSRHFSYSIWDFGNGRFLIVHYTLVAVEGTLWFALLTAPRTGLRAAHVRSALILSALAVAVVGTAQSIWHFGLIAFFQKIQPGLYRINSTLPDPNTLGSFLVLLIPMGLVAALQRWPGRWLAVGWTGLLGYCLIRSVSRTAWIGLTVASVGTLVVAGWRADLLGLRVRPGAARWMQRAVMASVLLGAVAALAVTFGLAGRDVSYGTARSPLDMVLFTLNLRRPMNELVPSRVDHWQAAINIWRDFPVLGAGIGKYTVLKGRYLPEATARWMFFTETHNYYLKILCELGAVGLVAFLAVLAGVARQAQRASVLADDAGRQRVAAIVIGLVAFLISSLAQDPLTLREMQYIFWAAVALLVLECPSADVADDRRSSADGADDRR
jgi:O-antigen ligase